MQLSVVILNYNVRYFLQQCLISVQAAIQNLDAEIIVVDNNSKDDSCAMVRERFPEVILIENPENSGFPKGNNIGVARAKGQFLCILNPDTVVAEDTFEKVMTFARSKSNLGIVGCKLIDGTGNFLPESKRGVPTPWVAFGKVFGLYKISTLFGKYYAAHLSEDQSGEVDILVGAFMFMQTATYREVGGFDENCFMYADDIDLSYMVLKTGKSNYYFHETSVIHYKGESTVRDGLYMRRFRDAMNFFYRKHFRRSALFDLMLQMGAVFFTAFKRSQQANAKVAPNAYLMIGTDLNRRSAVEKLLGKSVLHEAGSPKNTLNSLQGQAGLEIIFDNATLDFTTIIDSIESFKNKGFTFKIFPMGSDYLIGSNSSNDRGEIIAERLKQK